ncbi:MAG: hypothetical protein AAFY88_26445, partial [Acidobacteriota bacterium]
MTEATPARRRSLLIALFAAATLTALPAFGGYGFFSPAPVRGGSTVNDLVPAPDGSVWAVAGGALYTSKDEGRAFRQVSPWTGGYFLHPDPVDSSTLAAFDPFEARLFASRDAGESWAEVEVPGTLPRVRDVAVTRGAWFAIIFDVATATRTVYRSLDRGSHV